MKPVRVGLGMKLGAAFLGVILAMLALGYLFLNLEIPARFQEFRQESGLSQARQLAGLVGAYYLQTGSWEGVEPFLEAEGHRMSSSGAHQEMNLEENYVGVHFILADREGRIVVSHGKATGERLSGKDIQVGIPILVQGQPVGFLIPAMGHFAPLEQDFLDTLGRDQLLAGLVSLGLALVLTVILIRLITRPLRQLTHASEQAAQEGVQALQAVPIETRDEVGQLGQAFNRMVESLQRSEELRRRMIQDIAHELRNPLMVLRSRLEALQDRYLEISPENLALIYEETVLLERLVDDLQDLVLVEAGELRLQRHRLPIKEFIELIHRVTRSLYPGSKQQELHVTVDLSESKLKPDALLTVEVDPARLEQVLLNLLSNAQRHTPEGGRITVRVAMPVQSEVQVSVSDTGAGIPAEMLPHLFERFHKMEDDPEAGLGLGLTIAKKLVESHGGQLQVESRMRSGTTVRFALPLAQTDKVKRPS